jgi:hypothetical protein
MFSTKEAVESVIKKVGETATTVSTQANISENITTSGTVLETIATVKQLTQTVVETAEQIAQVEKEVLPDIQNGGRALDTGMTTIVNPLSTPLATTTIRVDATTTIKKTN